MSLPSRVTSSPSEDPIRRLLVFSLVDSVSLFAGDVERPQRPRVRYYSHLNQVKDFVHADGVNILNLASHAATCRHALLCTEHVAWYDVLPMTTPDIVADRFCKTLAGIAEGWRADASVAAGAETDARNPALTQDAVAATQRYLFRRTNEPSRAVDPPRATRFGQKLLHSLHCHKVRLERDGGFNTLFY